MDGINTRIAACIEALGIKKTDFATKLNVSQAFISQLTKGSALPSNRTIADICREFGVSETWLRTGEGEMFVPVERDLEIAAFFGDVLRGEKPDFRRRFVAALAKLDETEWALIEKIVLEVAESAKK